MAIPRSERMKLGVLSAALLAMTALFPACSASVASAIGADGSLRVSIHAEVPSALAVKFRKLADLGSGGISKGPFFDLEAIRKSLAARPGLVIDEIGQPGPDSVRLILSARNMAELAASPDFKDTGLITISNGPDWAECRFRMERGAAKVLASLLPGIDPYLMDALSPPALEEDPVTVDEYRTMLASILGERAMPAMEAASLDLSISAPGEVIGSGGGILSGSTLATKVSLIDVLVLEKPIELWMRWKVKR